MKTNRAINKWKENAQKRKSDPKREREKFISSLWYKISSNAYFSQEPQLSKYYYKHNN